MPAPRRSLKVIAAPGIGSVISAPPVLEASNTVEYTCGNCGIILMHAYENQVRNLIIHCTACGSYNSTDS